MFPAALRPFLLVVALAQACLSGMAAELSYYLPSGIEYDPAVPEPRQVLGYEVGEWHVRHDQMAAYLKRLAETSERMTIEVIGHTYEQRELLMLTISSPSNLDRIEDIRREHLRLSKPGEKPRRMGEQPVVLYMGYSVHGDESSAGNAALLVAYHLAAATGPQIEALLSEAVILLDPCLNPDGFSRFAQWANSHRGRNPVADPEHREHVAVWPAGRGNHYWFDLNRDWLLLQHPESRARIATFHAWKPNVHTDFHEMHSDSTYFFQPGVPERKNPLTPQKNVRLTERIASYHARALDAIGSLYYTEERFDDYYYGKGSTYPDINGGIGILFEQASSRGYLAKSGEGEIDFPFTIRNQFRTSLSTFEAALENRVKLLEYQDEFYDTSLAMARQHGIQGYVFGDRHDRARNWHLLDVLLLHDIEVYELAKEIERGQQRFEPGSAWVVPLQQPQFRLARTLFEEQSEFPDSIFYDVSAWTLPLATGIPYSGMERVGVEWVGPRIKKARFPYAEPPEAREAYAFAFSWKDHYAPRALYRLLEQGVKVRAATRKFRVRSDREVELDEGSIVIPMGIQSKSPRQVAQILERISRRDGVRVYPVYSGLTSLGIDLGSPSLALIEKPKVLLMVGSGVTAYEAGEVWHLLDQRMDMPVTMVDGERFGGVDLRDFTCLVMVNGSGSKISASGAEKIGRWVREGGVLVAIKDAVQWAARHKLAKVEFKKEEKEEERIEEKGKSSEDQAGQANDVPPKRLDYGAHTQIEDAKLISGAFFETDLDITHPIGYGYASRKLAVFRNSRLYMLPSKNPYQTVALYADKPRLSGYVHEEELEKLSGTASIIAEKRGKGAVILMVDNPNFRAYTHGTMKLFLNAIFFGGIIESTKVR